MNIIVLAVCPTPGGKSRDPSIDFESLPGSSRGAHGEMDALLLSAALRSIAGVSLLLAQLADRVRGHAWGTPPFPVRSPVVVGFSRPGANGAHRHFVYGFFLHLSIFLDFSQK